MFFSGLGIPRPWSRPESPPPQIMSGPRERRGLGKPSQLPSRCQLPDRDIGLGIPTIPKMPAPLFLRTCFATRAEQADKEGNTTGRADMVTPGVGADACRRTTMPGGSCSNDRRRTRPSRKARRLRVWIRRHGAYRVHGRREAGTGPWDMIGKLRFTGLQTAPRTARQSVNRPTYHEDPYPAPRW